MSSLRRSLTLVISLVFLGLLAPFTVAATGPVMVEGRLQFAIAEDFAENQPHVHAPGTPDDHGPGTSGFHYSVVTADGGTYRLVFPSGRGPDGFVNGAMVRVRGTVAGGALTGRSEQITVARAATVIRDRASGGDLLADFRDGVTHRFRTGAPEGYQRTAFERGYEKIPLPGYLKERTGGVSRAPGDMALGELLEERRAARDEKDPIIRPLRIRAAPSELQSRLALPIACFFFALLAAPLGITRVRSGKGAGVALSIGLILLYWLVHTTLQKQALEGRVPVGQRLIPFHQGKWCS